MKEQTDEKLQMIMDEDTIVSRILEGQTELYRLLVNRYAESALSVVRHIIHTQEDAEEVLQDAFVAAFQGLGSYDKDRASFKTWLLNIASHTALKRVERATDTGIVSMEEVFEPIAEPDVDVDEMLDDTSPDRMELLDRAVERLAPDDKLLVNLYYYDDMRLKDIATLMESTDSYLRSRLQWIRKKLCHTIKLFENYESK